MKAKLDRNEEKKTELIVECKDLINGDTFPLKYTHKGQDISPEIKLSNLNPKAKTITIIFEDMDKPITHWIIWNLPVMAIIPENISKHISSFTELGTKQKRPYIGPNPPKDIRHKYQFNVYILDCVLNMDADVNKRIILKAMSGHILQEGYVFGFYY